MTIMLCQHPRELCKTRNYVNILKQETTGCARICCQQMFHCHKLRKVIANYWFALQVKVNRCQHGNEVQHIYQLLFRIINKPVKV